jgi:hypothetical protein
MYLYNVTVKVNWSIQEAWVTWMKEQHIPEVIHTGCFTHSRFFKLLDQDETEGPTYIMQYTATHIDHYNNYINTYADALRKKTFDAWGNQFIAFRTLMEEI